MTPDSSDTTIHVMLPAFNEEKGLAAMLPVLHRTLKHAGWKHHVYVVDDGSSDGTADVVGRAANSEPVTLLSHSRNRGLSAAMETGLKHVVAHANDGDIVVTLDSDDTHPIGLMPSMISLINEGRDVVVASRFHRASRIRGVPLFRQVTAIAAALLFKLLFPIRGIRDYTCGYRAYRVAALKKAMGTYGDRFITEQGFSCMVDLLLKLGRLNLIFGEAPMILRYDQKDGLSKMPVGSTIFATLKLALRRRMGHVD